MEIQLRPYQLAAKAQVRESLKTNRRVILCLPTGAGKTVVFTDFTASTLKKNPLARVIILTDRAELLKQAGGTLANFGINFEPITANNKVINPYARCYVGMVETFARRITKDVNQFLLTPNLFIIDECHKGSFKKLFEKIPPNIPIIGATATPLAATRKDPLLNYYQDIVCPVQIGELVNEGHLVKARTFSAQIDRSELQYSGVENDYSERSQMAAFDKRTVYAGLIEKYSALVPNTKTLVFNINVAHSLAVTQAFNNAGIPAMHVDGSTPEGLRNEIIAGFKARKFLILCNVGILNAGFDDPSIETVIVNRATMSVPLWLQMCGRGSRLYPSKAHFNILDMAENYKELGLWESERDWDTMFRKPPKISDKVGIAPAKECVSCQAILAASAMLCIVCGALQPVKEKDTEEKDAAFGIIDTAYMDKLNDLSHPKNWEALTIEELVQVQEHKRYKMGWIKHQLAKRAGEDLNYYFDMLAEVGSIKGYSKGWSLQQTYPQAVLTPLAK